MSFSAPEIPQVVVKRERWPGSYGARGVPLVYIGQTVVPDQPVLRLLRDENAGRVGQRKEGGLSASYTPFSSDEAAIQSEPSIETDYGESIPAGLHGQVVGFTNRGGVIIESRAVRIQGIIGAGRQVVGVVTIWRPTPSSEQLIPPGAILVVPEPLTLALLYQAINSGVVGIVTSSMALRDLEGFLRTDVLQLLTSDAVELAQEHLPPLTLLCTEGVGLFHMPSYILDLLRRYEGSIGLLTGITSVRRHNSPELIISLSTLEMQDEEWQPEQRSSTLSPGVQVRVRAGEYQGVIGRIDYFFVHERVFRAGIRARAVRLLLEDGSFCVVPLPLIERIR